MQETLWLLNNILFLLVFFADMLTHPDEMSEP